MDTVTNDKKNSSQFSKTMENLAKEYQATFQPIYHSLHQQFKTIYEQTDGFKRLQETLNKIVPPAVQELEKMINNQAVKTNLMSFQTALHQQFKMIYEQTDGFRKLRKTLNEIVAPAQGLAKVLEKQSQILQYFPNKKGIIKINLYLTYWIVIDNCLLEKLHNMDYSNPADIEDIIVSYYSENNWNQAETLIQSWQKFNFVGERVNIFLDTLEINRISNERKKFNPNRLACPALIAQIDNLIKFLKESIYLKYVGSANPICSTQDWKQNKKKIIIQQIDHIVDRWSALMLRNIIFKGLFRDSKLIPKKSAEDMISNEKKGFPIFRHKILHGDQEYMDYGTKENFIKILLYTDFIIYLISCVQSENIEPEENIQ